MDDNAANPLRRTTSKVVGVLLIVAAAGWLWTTRTVDDERWLFFRLWKTRDLLLACGCAILALWILLPRRGRWGMLLAALLAGVTVALFELVGLTGLIQYPAAFGIQQHDGLGGEPIPHLDLRGETYPDLARAWGYPCQPVPFHLQTDRRGFRNAHDRAEADVYLLGDSVLVAGLLPFEQTLTARLEAAWGLRTMNLALIGIGPQRERDLLLESQLPLEGRLILHVLFEGNDLADSAQYRQPAQSSSPFHEQTFAFNLLLWAQKHSDGRHLARERRWGRVGNTDYLFMWTNEAFRDLPEEWHAIAETLAELHERVTQAGGTYAVVYVPAKIRVVGPLCTWPPESTLHDYASHLNPLREQLTGWCHQQGILWIDLSDPLIAAARQGTIPFFPDDSHPNAEGHRVACKVIAANAALESWRQQAAQRAAPFKPQAPPRAP